MNTRFAHELKGIFSVLLAISKPFLLSPEKGSATSVYLASSGEVQNVTGKYFVKSKPVEAQNADITTENRKILWEKSLELSEL